MDEESELGAEHSDEPEHGWGEPSRRPTGSAHPSTYLVREIGGIGREMDRALGDHLTVNPTDLRAMSLLLGRGEMTLSELAAALDLGVPATSMAVERLVRLGHVSRERDLRDRRRVLIRATPGSTTTTRDALMPMIREIDGLLDAMTPQEQQVVQRYLQGVAETMRRHVDRVRDQTRRDRTDQDGPS